MYHVELRQFPHNFRRFNLSERELHETFLDAWAKGEWVELGERKWNSHQADLTVLEGLELPVEQLSMGRGWRNARRHCKDVTEQVILAARQAENVGQSQRLGSDAGARSRLPSPSMPAGTDANVLSEALGRAVLSRLGDNPIPLVRAWQLALEHHPDRTPSECLALAEDLVRR